MAMKLEGSIRVPSDKSISHRAVLFSALAEGTSRLADVLPSDDVLATLAAVEQMGATVDMHEDAHGLAGSITGFAGKPSCKKLEIDCGNSGTTTRLMLGVLAGLGVEATLYGDASLSRRPMARVMKPLGQMGASFTSHDGCLPVHVAATVRPLEPVDYATEQASAQVKSAILLAGLFADGVTRVTEPAKSRDHTERLLPAFGVPVDVRKLTASLEGPALLHAHDVRVPADPSSAAFVAVAAVLLSGSEVTIEQVALNPTRTGALSVLQDMGCVFVYDNECDLGAEPVGDIIVRSAFSLRGVTVAAERIPALIDEIPVLSLAAAAACGETVFRGVGELRVKESDRLAAIIDGLTAMGVQAYADGDDLHIVGCGPHLPEAPSRIAFPTHHDHRLAMTWHLAGLVFGFSVELDDPECVSVSWPGFFEDIERLKS